MKVELHPEAEAELLAAASYYEREADDLGVELLDAVEGACRRIASHPESGRRFGPRLRRLLVPGFPFGILYRADSQRVFVVAVAHFARRPGYWRSRS